MKSAQKIIDNPINEANPKDDDDPENKNNPESEDETKIKHNPKNEEDPDQEYTHGKCCFCILITNFFFEIMYHFVLLYLRVSCFSLHFFQFYNDIE